MNRTPRRAALASLSRVRALPRLLGDLLGLSKQQSSLAALIFGVIFLVLGLVWLVGSVAGPTLAMYTLF